jgi:hypothetical protein
VAVLTFERLLKATRLAAAAAAVVAVVAVVAVQGASSLRQVVPVPVQVPVPVVKTTVGLVAGVKDLRRRQRIRT